MYTIRLFFHFVKAVITGIPDTWKYHTWSKYSKGYVRDQINDIYWLWQDLITARSLHRRTTLSRKSFRGK